MNRPVRLLPVGKDYLWGGSRLNDDFSLNLPFTPLAEAWVCSTHPDGLSTMEDGEQSGQTLADLLRKRPSLMGTHASKVAGGQFPILIKLIDAKQKLSVQVHPSDEQAEGDFGKTEMWYVLDARRDSTLTYGFNRDVSATEVREAVMSGNVENLLNTVPVHKGDVFMVNPGTVHAIGAGVLLAEVQESSNLTYRLYDYDRVDKRGNKRPLHVDKALSVARLTSSAAPRQPLRALKYRPGYATELLGRCKYFQVERLLLNTEGRKLAAFQTGANSFHVLLCLSGCGNISGEDYSLNFFKGDCVFVPADSIPLQLHGKAELLDVSC